MITVVFLFKKKLFFAGNLLVTITVARFMDRNNVTNIFIVNLSSSNILVLSFCLPFRVNICLTVIKEN